LAKKTIVYSIRGYQPEIIEAAGVKLGVLKRVKEDWNEKVLRSRQGPLDALINYATRMTRDKELRDLGYVEVTVEAPGLVVTHGDRPKYDWTSLLFPSPSKLIRIGVVRGKSSEGGKYQVTPDDIEWHDVSHGDYYVFEGICEAPSDVLMVILDTENGRRILTQCKSSS
jgi:hypothetical protein